jgi:conjugal transfer mating pair stabilization protein TraG
VFSTASTSVSSYNLEDRDYLIRTIAFEAGHESALGKAAVAHVVLNRKKSGRWGHTIRKIVTQPWQFEPWMTRRDEIQKLSPNDPQYRIAARIADRVLDGDIPDPTAGATHFLNEKIVRQRRGGSLPRWAQEEGLVIGRHTFYWPDEGGSSIGQASLAMLFTQLVSLSC